MNQYATSEYYKDIFKGTLLTDEDVDKYLREASEKIDSITFNRIVRIGFDNLTLFQKEKIQQAVCYQAEYILKNGFNDEEKEETISSYSVLDISVNVKDKSDSEKTPAEKECMSEMAYNLMFKTGLMTRGSRF